MSVTEKSTRRRSILELEGAKLLVDDIPNYLVGSHGFSYQLLCLDML